MKIARKLKIERSWCVYSSNVLGILLKTIILNEILVINQTEGDHESTGEMSGEDAHAAWSKVFPAEAEAW